MDVDHVRKPVVVGVPQRIDELGPGHHFIDMGNEVVQEAELASGMRSTQQRADARCELAEVERLREVVVGTGIETGDPINDRNCEP